MSCQYMQDLLLYIVSEQFIYQLLNSYYLQSKIDLQSIALCLSFKTLKITYGRYSTHGKQVNPVRHTFTHVSEKQIPKHDN